MISVVAAQALNPCQPAVASFGLPQSRPAANPPSREAMMPDAVHQIAAPMERPSALGFSLAPALGSRVDAPTPIPIMFKISWATIATTTPAKTAPHEILLRAMLRRTSAGVTGLMCGA